MQTEDLCAKDDAFVCHIETDNYKCWSTIPQYINWKNSVDLCKAF